MLLVYLPHWKTEHPPRPWKVWLHPCEGGAGDGRNPSPYAMRLLLQRLVLICVYIHAAGRHCERSGANNSPPAGVWTLPERMCNYYFPVPLGNDAVARCRETNAPRKRQRWLPSKFSWWRISHAMEMRWKMCCTIWTTLLRSHTHTHTVGKLMQPQWKIQINVRSCITRGTHINIGAILHPVPWRSCTLQGGDSELQLFSQYFNRCWDFFFFFFKQYGLYF